MKLYDMNRTLSVILLGFSLGFLDVAHFHQGATRAQSGCQIRSGHLLNKVANEMLPRREGEQCAKRTLTPSNGNRPKKRVLLQRSIFIIETHDEKIVFV